MHDRHFTLYGYYQANARCSETGLLNLKSYFHMLISLRVHAVLATQIERRRWVNYRRAGKSEPRAVTVVLGAFLPEPSRLALGS
jgi:hypothetical protein